MTLKVSDQISARVKAGEISDADASRFSRFVETCNNELMTHSVITDNKYSAWFATGEANREIVKHFIIQFSVFSNLFLIAQMMKVINANSVEGMRASKEILANELGVIFNKQGNQLEGITDTDREGDPDMSPSKAESTAVPSASAPPTSSGSSKWVKSWAWDSTTWASAATAPRPPSFSVIN